MAHVLLIEDDAGIRIAVVRALLGRGHAVDAAGTGLDGLQILITGDPDVVVLDLGLPDVDGERLLGMIRAVSQVAIIVATARDDEGLIVRLLDAGADDYVVKPYDPAHLEARVRAVLRRTGSIDPAGEPPLRVGGLTVDRARRAASVDGRPIELTRLEFDLLAYLATHPGRVVSRAELLREVWQRTDAARTVDVHLSWLRRKLGDSPTDPRFIHVNRGVGVMLEDRVVPGDDGLMYRRLVAFALLVVTVAVTALVIPLAFSARDNVRSGNLATLAEEARLMADAWEAVARQPTGDDESGDDHVPTIDVPGDPGEVVLIYPDDTVVGGPVPAGAAEVVAEAKKGHSASVDTGHEGYAAAPATFNENVTGAVLAIADADRMQEGLEARLAAVAALCALLLAGAGAAAWRLAHRTARPIRELAATADAIAEGDLTARVAHSEIREVDDVGVALNRLATRVQELLEEERAAAAELAHQLRTPLTVLSADIDAVADPVVRQRLADDALTLQRTTDEIINSARRVSREGLHASCDAAAVVAGRAKFWQVLADFQGRTMNVAGTTSGPHAVRLTEYDLTTAVDILLQNVFTHTDEGVGLALSVGSKGDVVEVTVTDSGQGFADLPESAPRAGSTGLGLAIAERLAVASGGSLIRTSTPGGGARVTLRLGRASG